MTWYIANEGRTSVSYTVLATLRTLFQKDRGKWRKPLGRIMLLTVFWFGNKSLSLETAWGLSEWYSPGKKEHFAKYWRGESQSTPTTEKQHTQQKYLPILRVGKKLKPSSVASAAESSEAVSTRPFAGRRDKGTPGSRFCMDTKSPLWGLCHDDTVTSKSPTPWHGYLKIKMERDFSSHVAPCWALVF